jgi:hypothetical protein
MPCSIAQELPGSVPSGARTFLEARKLLAIIRPTASVYKIATGWVFADDGYMTHVYRLVEVRTYAM